MTKLIYFDNSVAKKLLEEPEKYWNSFYDNSIGEFGLSIHPLQSYYLFFEYFGLTKKKFLNISTSTLKFKHIKKLNENGLILDSYFAFLCKDIESQLSMDIVKKLITKHIEQQKIYRSFFDGSQELYNIFFREILELFNKDYPNFIQHATLYLAWDYFCILWPEEISIENLRCMQIDIWLQLVEQGHRLPFGKIIDDIPHSNLHGKTKFKEQKDMVDSEALTYLFMGHKNEFNESESVNILTLDNPINLQERIELGLSHLNYIENTLKKSVDKKFGKVYCLNKDTFLTKQVLEPQIPICL